MGLGKSVWSETRRTLTKILSSEDTSLKNNVQLRAKALVSKYNIII